MKFILIDRIDELEPGRRIVAHKCLTLAEEYLQDHFPRFPVMPGVLMLEALTQSAAWLARASQGFAHSVVLLREARNVTYKSFVSPGQTLTIEAVCKQLSERESVFQASGQSDGRPVLKGQLTLRHLNLAEQDPQLTNVDSRLRERFRQQFELLGGHRAMRTSEVSHPVTPVSAAV